MKHIHVKQSWSSAMSFSFRAISMRDTNRFALILGPSISALFGRFTHTSHLTPRTSHLTRVLVAAFNFLLGCSGAAFVSSHLFASLELLVFFGLNIYICRRDRSLTFSLSLTLFLALSRRHPLSVQFLSQSACDAIKNLCPVTTLLITCLIF